MKVNLSVYLTKPVIGEQLISSFTEVAALNNLKLKNELVYLADAPATTLIAYPYGYDYAVQLMCGEHFAQESIDPVQRYVSFSLMNTKIRGGIVKAVIIRDETVFTFVKNYRHYMVKHLASLQKVTEEEILENSQRLQGSGINDIRFACPACNSGLKNNPGQCPFCGSPLGNLLPIY